VELLQLDVLDDQSVRSCVRKVLDQAGRSDALVNNAGYALIGSLEETTIGEAKDLFETNFFGVLRMSQAVLPVMRGQGHGRIANIGSVVGLKPLAFRPWRRAALAAAVLALLAAGPWRLLVRQKLEPPVIAVLPFKNLSPQPGSDYFTDGLTDEIIRNLSIIDGLQVKSSTSSFTFKDKPRNIREVGAELGANLVLEGSVMRDGEKLRIVFTRVLHA
jgi:short subunit dehydrogenase